MTNPSETSTLTPFHVAVPVLDLASSLAFYQWLFPVTIGRQTAQWADLNLYGHQFVLHEVPEHTPQINHNPVDGHAVPVPHYGVILPMADWQVLADRLQAEQVEFVIEPYIRFQGQAGEQGTFFLLDPSGNALEFKGFNDFSQIFAR
ncbi:MAG: glyoxalase [Gammaproteobacteria bacterium]|nr:glyoxalase [Gammaproteobacteria bacterium]